MAKRRNDKPRKPLPQEDKELEAFYARYRREFTAADLQKYTEIEEGVPLKEVISECVKIHRKYK